MKVQHSRHNIDDKYPRRWNIIKRKKNNDPWSRRRFGCICSGSNLRLKYSKQPDYSRENSYNSNNNQIIAYSQQNHRNSYIHKMMTRSMRKTNTTPLITDNETNNGLQFDDDNEFAANWIIKDNLIEYGNIYDNDYSHHLHRIEMDIENLDKNNTYKEEAPHDYNFEIDRKTNRFDADEYNPKDDTHNTQEQEQENITNEDEIEIECDILSESSMDANDYRIAMELEKEMNVYSEEIDGLYEPITVNDIKNDKAAQRENDIENELDQQRTNRYTNNGYHSYSSPATSTVRKPHRYRPGTVALKQIRRYQNSWKMLISKSEFERCIGAIVYKAYPHNIKFQQSAIYALQQGLEAYAVDLFENSTLCAIHAHRVNVCPEDVQMATRIRQKANIDRVRDSH